MDISGLTSTEAKQLLLINKKIEYTNKDHAAVVLKIIKERSYFQSSTGKVYIKSLENIVNDMTPLDCIYCRKMLDGEGAVICGECVRKLEDKARLGELEEPLDKNENKEKYAKESPGNNEQHDNFITRNKIKVISGILALFIIILLAVFFITRNDASKKTDNEVGILNNTEDGFLILGEKYSEADRRFGEYENVVSENTRYYPSCGISILYNTSTGTVIYIDNDGTGTGEKTVPIFGVLPGDSLTQAKSYLTENGITAIDVSGDTFVCQFSSSEYENTVYEIDVVFSDNVVKLVSAKLKKN